jgi:integrase/recombinase XerC
MQEREQPSFEEQYAQLPEVVHSYLEHVRVQKRLAERTHTLYALDLIKLQSFAQAAARSF